MSAISWREQFTFNERMMLISALQYTNTLNWIFLGLAHWKTVRGTHTIPIPRQLIFALNPQTYVLSREAANTYLQNVTRIWLKPTI